MFGNRILSNRRQPPPTNLQLNLGRPRYSRDPSQEVLSGGFENVIVLSDEFYKEVIAHPIPADVGVVKVFCSAPAVLDLFKWLTYRCFTVKSEERIPLFGDFASRHNWDQSNTAGHDDFAQCLNSGWAKFVQSG